MVALPVAVDEPNANGAAGLLDEPAVTPVPNENGAGAAEAAELILLVEEGALVAPNEKGTGLGMAVSVALLSVTKEVAADENDGSGAALSANGRDPGAGEREEVASAASVTSLLASDVKVVGG